jgi:hypothetical protein
LSVRASSAAAAAAKLGRESDPLNDTKHVARKGPALVAQFGRLAALGVVSSAVWASLMMINCQSILHAAIRPGGGDGEPHLNQK